LTAGLKPIKLFSSFTDCPVSFECLVAKDKTTDIKFQSLKWINYALIEEKTLAQSVLPI
jgi:hypothetical protein